MLVGDDLKPLLLLQHVERVRTDTEIFFDLTLQGLAGGEDRLEPRRREGFQDIQPRLRKQSAHGHLDMAVLLPQRQQLLLEQDARGKATQHRAVQLDILERCVCQAVFLREPLEHVLLGIHLHLARGAKILQGRCIGGGELMTLHHAIQKICMGCCCYRGNFAHGICVVEMITPGNPSLPK